MHSVHQKEYATYISPWLLYCLALIFLGLWFAASFWHGRYTWGFDYLRYYPIWVRFVWFLCGSALFTFALVHIKKNREEAHPRNPQGWQLFVLLLAVAACFIVFRNKIPLLGDGTLRIKEIAYGRLFSVTQPLTTLVHGLLYKLITHTIEVSNPAELAYVIISIAAGLGAIVVYYSIARNWFEEVKWFCMLFLLSLGLNQIFYGYVESYALFMLGVWCYLWFGVRAMDQKSQPFVPTILCSVTITCHSAGLFLIPSLCYLWCNTLTNKKEISWSKVLTHALLLLAGPLLVFSLGLLVAGQEQFAIMLAEAPLHPWLPLWQDFSGYGILSPRHLADIFNQLLLIIPGALFLLLILLSIGAKIRFDQRFKFLCSALLGGLLFILMIDPKLGARRDWDLFAWIGIPIVFLALFWWKQRVYYKAILGPAAFLSVWLFWPWIGVNASEDFSIRRYIDILDNETKLVACGYEYLAIHYRRQDQLDKEKWAYMKALEKEPTHPRMLYHYSRVLALKGELDSALSYIREAVQMDSLNAHYWHCLGNVLMSLNQHEQAVWALMRALSLERTNANILFSLGYLYSKLNRWEAADSAFFLAKEYGYDGGELRFNWGRSQLHVGEFEKAIQNFEKALEYGFPQNVVMPLYEEARRNAQRRKSIEPNH